MLRYCPHMLLNKLWHLPALVAVGLNVASADVVELKDAAVISGKILAEKRDAVVVDVGYTALVIPKSAVTKIIPGEQVVTPKASAKDKKVAPGSAQPAVP